MNKSRYISLLFAVFVVAGNCTGLSKSETVTSVYDYANGVDSVVSSAKE